MGLPWLFLGLCIWTKQSYGASVLDLAEAFSGEIKHIAARNEPKRSVSDITRITAKLEWKPEVNVLAWIKQVK